MASAFPDMVLVDTTVLLEDPDVLGRIAKNGGQPCLANAIIGEITGMDVNKLTSGAAKQNALYFKRKFSTEKSSLVQSLPGDLTIKAGDRLASMPFANVPVNILTRPAHQGTLRDGTKIIEIALDYGLILLTRDQGLKDKATAAGVRAELWTGKQQVRQPQSKKPGATDPVPFNLPSIPLAEEDSLLSVKDMPVEGSMVMTGKGKAFQLVKEISQGGEGVIYSTTLSGLVCKVYHKDNLTAQREKKISLMLSRPVKYPGICWPVDFVKNKQNEFVGYLMPKADGKPMQHVMFVKPKLEKTFPHWRRADLVNICLKFLDQIEALHSLNIIVGDINPLNFLVEADSTKLWMVDTDSFQIEAFPCQVGTVNFTAPEIQGKNYRSFLRSKDHELFAVATMLFMILLPGNPPYSQQGGGSPQDNIKASNFPYPFRSEKVDASGKNVPQGPWYRIWMNIPKSVREGFYETFGKNARLSVADWREGLREYARLINKGRATNELFPMTIKPSDPVMTTCTEPGCGRTEEASKRRLERLKEDGKGFLCSKCMYKINLKMLAKKGHEARKLATGGEQQPRSQGAFTDQPTRTRTVRQTHTSTNPWVLLYRILKN